MIQTAKFWLSIFGFLAFTANQLYAQKDAAGYIQVQSGMSISSGEYASVSFNNPSSGYAKDGFTTSLLLGHNIKGYFGLFAMLNLQFNSFNSKAYEKNLNEVLYNFNWKVNSGTAWSVTGLAFGPHISIPIHKFGIDLRACGGFLNFKSPEIELFVQNKNQSLPDRNLLITSANSTSFSLGLGASIKYEFKRDWVVTLNADAFSGVGEFKDIENQISLFGQDLVYLEKQNMIQEYNNLLLTAGVGFIF